MGFNDEDGLPLINAEHKVRIALSERARMVMAEDMDVFHIKKPTTFINTVFRNYRGEAKSSINNYLDKKKKTWTVYLLKNILTIKRLCQPS